MKSQISSVDLYYLVKELQFLVGGKVDKIANLGKKKLILNIHVPSTGKKQLFIDVEKSLYLTEYVFPGENPSEFCMFLRKHLDNSRLRSIKQLGFERILDFVFETKEETYDLVLELFSKGNILLLKDNKVLIAAEYHTWKDRAVRPKVEYDYPKREHNPLEIDEKTLKSVFEKSDKESVIKSLAIDLGFGGVYSEEIIAHANVEKDKKPNELGSKKVEKIIKAIKEIASKKLEPQIVYENDIISDITPFKLLFYKDKKAKDEQSFSAALDNYFSQLSISQQQLKQQEKVVSTQKIINQQEHSVKKLQEEEQEAVKAAEKLYENYETVSNLLKEFKEITKKHSWDEIKTKLKNHKTIKEVNSKDKTIILEIN